VSDARSDRGGLEEKTREALGIIREGLDRFAPQGLAIAFGGGADSTVVVHLIREVLGGGPIPPIFHLADGEPPEVPEFCARLLREWNLAPFVAPADVGFPALPPALSLGRLAGERGWRGVFAGLRRDEHEAYAAETTFADDRSAGITRIQPILAFTRKDVWQYLRAHGIPYCDLYGKGYRSLRQGPWPGWDVGAAWRAGQPGSQAEDGEMEEVAERLRELGYL
jgi:phosphoadenosine phosphosulfate reductase